MSNDLWSESPASAERPIQMPPIGSLLPRAFTLLVGTILVLVGAYYAISVLVTVLRIAAHPEGIEGTLVIVAKLLQVDQLQVNVNDAPVSLGRILAAAFLLPWYLLSSFIAMQLVQLGARMIMGEIAERREALKTMRVLMATVRAEIESIRPRKTGGGGT